MNIIFDLRNTGLGNNGGSQTLVKSANILSKLGHVVKIIDSVKNQHTWNKLDVEHIIVKNVNYVPNSDIVITTGFKSIIQTLKLPSRCGKKIMWCRGWETWIYKEKDIVNLLRDDRIIKIVNSICLQLKLKKYNINSYIIRPGNDFEDFEDKNKRTNKKIIIGGLYHSKHKTKNSDLIIKIAKKLKLKYNNIELHMFGTSNDPNNNIIDKYIKQPDIKEKNNFYNNIHIWLSTSELEGLHIVPQEAALCGCVIVGTNAEMSGTQDYLIDGKTGIISNNNKNDFIKKVELLIHNDKLRNKLSKAGREKIINLGNREENMFKFIKLMYNLLGNKDE